MNIKSKRRIFFFSKLGGVSLIYLKRTHSNIFVTITDLKNNVLKCVTSGSSCVGSSKKQKKAPMALESIVKKCIPVFLQYRIKIVRLILQTRISVLFYTLLKELRFHGIKVRGVVVRRKVAFNGVRKRKLRRI